MQVSQCVKSINWVFGLLCLINPHALPIVVNYFLTLQCTYLLLLRVLADSHLLEQVDKVATDAEALGRLGRAGRRTVSSSSSSRTDAASIAAELRRPNWQMMQAPVFDMIKCIFAK
jgi:hypothetical protein